MVWDTVLYAGGIILLHYRLILSLGPIVKNYKITDPSNLSEG